VYIYSSPFEQQQITSLEYYVLCYYIDIHQTHKENSKFNFVTETRDIRIVRKRIRSRASVWLRTYVCIQALLCDYACKYVATYGCVHV